MTNTRTVTFADLSDFDASEATIAITNIVECLDDLNDLILAARKAGLLVNVTQAATMDDWGKVQAEISLRV